MYIKIVYSKLVNNTCINKRLAKYWSTIKRFAIGKTRVNQIVNITIHLATLDQNT